MPKNWHDVILSVLSSTDQDIHCIHTKIYNQISPATIRKYLRQLEHEGLVSCIWKEKPFPDTAHTILTSYWRKRM
jgi:hypothetical protein